VDPETVRGLLTSSFQVEFIVNVSRESFWTGEAIALVTSSSVAFGGMGDLQSALSLPNVRSFVNREFEFVERGLGQHNRVQSIDRLHDRKYLIKRRGLSDVIMVFLNEYELTADHVRTARNRYGDFTAVAITNPYGGATSSAKDTAKSIGTRIYKWKDFLGRLHKP
jgi:hypothetical protein